MKLAVVVTLRNEAHTIRDLLESMRTQTRLPDEVILVDGGSTDDTVAIARTFAGQLPMLRLLEAPGSNISQGRNHGIAATECPIIAVTDAGCVPCPDWLSRLSHPLELDAEVGLVQGVALPRPANHLEACIGRCSLAQRVCVGGESFFPTARSLAFRRTTWAQAGGFPEWLDIGEDLAFIVTATGAGARLQVEPEAVVRWRPRSSYRAVVEQFYHYAAGSARAGLSRTLHLRTVAQSLAAAASILLGILLQHWVPWALLLLLAAFYLWRKARAGCFDIPTWRTYYRVPLVLLAIHLGTMAGVVHGNWLRMQAGFGHAFAQAEQQ